MRHFGLKRFVTSEVVLERHCIPTRWTRTDGTSLEDHMNHFNVKLNTFKATEHFSN